MSERETRDAKALSTRTREAAQAFASVALKGVPAVRAALHGARLGAGAKLGPQVLERLGVRVLAKSVSEVARELARPGSGQGLALVWRARGGAVLRAGARELSLYAPEGLSLRVATSGNAVASVTHETVRALAGQSARAALKGLGRAALHGAAAGAVLDGAVATYEVLRAARSPSIAHDDDENSDSPSLRPRDAARFVALRVARGAVAGGAGVAAAGVVSAGVALTGLTVSGLPVALPIVTMVGAGMLAERAFDRFVPSAKGPRAKGAARVP